MTVGTAFGTAAVTMALQGDGKILVSGFAHQTPEFIEQAGTACVRLNSNGSTDASFGTAGIVRFDDVSTQHVPPRIAPVADGRILISMNGAVHRLTSTGIRTPPSVRTESVTPTSAHGSME